MKNGPSPLRPRALMAASTDDSEIIMLWVKLSNGLSPDELDKLSVEMKLSDVLTTQLMFIKKLAPYFHAINHRDGAADFLGRLYDLWFIRWRLKLQDYGGSYRSLNDGMRRKTKWIKDLLELEASLLPEGPCENFSPETFMTICERRQGYSAKRKHGGCEETHDGPRPRPRPRPKKAKTSVDAVDASPK